MLVEDKETQSPHCPEGNQSIIKEASSTTNPNYPNQNSPQNNSQQIQNTQTIDHKKELEKGNFLPSIYLLENNKISVNDVMDDDGNTLLHLAGKYSYLNIIRALLEIFNADINIKNKFGQTLIHILCSKPTEDIFIFTYIFKVKDVLLDIEDNNGFTPLTYTIINNFNSIFFALLSYKVDVKHIDKKGDTLFYHAIINDNLTVLKYLIFNTDMIMEENLNDRRFSDILIKSKGEKCCKYLLKHYFIEKQIDCHYLFYTCNNSIKSFEDNDGYNLFNYQMLNAFYKYKLGSLFKSFMFTLFSRKMKEFRLYNLMYIFKDLYLGTADIKLKKLVFIIYSMSICFIFSVIYFFLTPIRFKWLSFDLLFALYQHSSIFFVVYCSYKLFYSQLPTKIKYFYFNKDSHKLPVLEQDNQSHNQDQGEIKEKNYVQNNINNNIYLPDIDLNEVCNNAINNNIFEFPDNSEYCPICFIKKSKTTVHCNRCNKCVTDFYYHPYFIDVCLNKENVNYYSVIILCIWFLHFSLISIISQIEIPSQHLSKYFFANLYYFVTKTNFLGLGLITYLFVTGIILLGINIELMFCKYSDITYYLMFKAHKIASGPIKKRMGEYHNIPLVSSVSRKTYIKQIICPNCCTKKKPIV